MMIQKKKSLKYGFDKLVIAGAQHFQSSKSEPEFGGGRGGGGLGNALLDLPKSNTNALFSCN